MKQLIIIVLLLSSFFSVAQIATIQDKDGYSNVREKESTNSTIIYKVKIGEVFWYNPDDFYDDITDWITVYIPKNKFSIECRSTSELQGYLHKSRVIPLTKLEKYEGSNLTFKYTLQPFTKEGKIIDYNNEKYISTINGLDVWGTDGNMPRTEIKEIAVTLNGKNITIPNCLFMNLYECNNKFDFYKIENNYIISQFNSDGAGGYELAWVVTENGIKQRLVGTLY